MEIATISANGQITVPVDVRRRLHLGPGDQIVFTENEIGDIVLVRPNAAALLDAQRAFHGAAEKAGFTSEEDLDAVIAQVRAERKQSTT